jgi:hypothetical protein
MLNDLLVEVGSKSVIIPNKEELYYVYCFSQKSTVAGANTLSEGLTESTVTNTAFTSCAGFHSITKLILKVFPFSAFSIAAAATP